MKSINIAIIGMGSRGLTLLHRFICHAKNNNDINFSITSFNDGDFGTGEHSVNQPDYLLLNTTAGQLTMFPELDQDMYKGDIEGLSFYSWCKEKNIKVDLNCHQNQETGSEVSEDDFLPRRLLGEYLKYSYKHMINNLPENLTIKEIKEKVIDIEVDDLHHLIKTNNSSYSVDFACLTLGHTGSNLSNHNSINYKDKTKLDLISSEDNVLVNGLGLTAMDMIAELTLGRGGKIQRNERGFPVAYQPSGKEPNIILASKKGIPFRVRPELKNKTHRNKSYFLRKIIKNRLKDTFDFNKDILPYIKLEMRVSYILCQMKNQEKVILEHEFESLNENEIDKIDSFIRTIERNYNSLDFDLVFKNCAPSFNTQKDFQTWFCDYIKRDLDDAWEGVDSNPLKTSIEVLRDLRDIVRDAVNFNKLDSLSDIDFYTDFYPHCNRLVGGPQRERHEDLLALINSGIVNVTINKNFQNNLLHTEFNEEIKIDKNINAFIPNSGINNSNSVLINNLYKSGLLESKEISSSISPVHVNNKYKVISKKHCDSKIWCIGPNIEGVTFYNHYIPTVGKINRPFSESEIIVKDIISKIN